jgi:hypothetical protein
MARDAAAPRGVEDVAGSPAAARARLVVPPHAQQEQQQQPGPHELICPACSLCQCRCRLGSPIKA